MSTATRRYPVGIQTFERLIKESYIYIDKTDLVWKIAKAAPYVFLSRPRRFGKSLLTTTLESYFEGKKELFEGLRIMDLESEWISYPVIHLDLSTAKNKPNAVELRRYLNLYVTDLMPEYADESKQLPGEKLANLITQCYTKTGKQVVLLIDEYDSPLLDVLDEDEHLADYKKVMQEFYQPLKACEKMIHYCFITGITKFSQLSIFSTLNNIMNVSMNPEFSTICGITEQELTTAMADDIAMLAAKENCSPDQMHKTLKTMYDGYHFSENSEELYNPFSLMNCFAQKSVKDYWFESGTPTFLFKQMQRFHTDISKLDDITAPESAFNRPTETLTNALPLLYQSGYLTIKDYDRESRMYRLGIPNQEVRIGLTENMLPFFIGIDGADVQVGCAFKTYKALKNGDVDLAMRELQAFFAGVPYIDGFKKKLADASTREGFYEYTMYLILSMMNIYVQTQVRVQGGRIDMVVFSTSATYIFEFKVNDTAANALSQIDEKRYAASFATDPLPVVKIGVQFDIDNWNIKEWAIS